MIIYCEQRNQLCNRLFALLPPLSFAMEKKEKMIIFFFPKTFLEYFPHLKELQNVRFVYSTNTVFPTGGAKILQGMMTIFLKPFTAAGKQFNYRELKDHKNRLLVVKGWRHRHAASYIPEQYENIKAAFQPQQEVKLALEKAFRKNNSEVIVGVHVRRGDYKHFKNGRYYFDDAVYISKMEEILNLFKASNLSTRFFISSNEPVSVAIREKFDLLSVAGKQPITDLYALAYCDYIIGPPSTFSQWASFIGQKPMQFIHSASAEITMQNFKIVDAIDSFREKQ